MATNKILFDGVGIDLSTDTVASANDIAEGKVGHLNDGTVVTGTHSGSTPTQVKTLTLGSASPSAVTPDSGYALSQVTPQIDSTVIKAENIAQGVTMLGILGTHQGGGGGGTGEGVVHLGSVVKVYTGVTATRSGNVLTIGG